jgi:hypothetical protein
MMDKLDKWNTEEKRRTFLQRYTDWGLWFYSEELEVRYYKYDLPDGARIVVREYQGRNYRRPGFTWKPSYQLIPPGGKYIPQGEKSEDYMVGYLIQIRNELMKERERYVSAKA